MTVAKLGSNGPMNVASDNAWRACETICSATSRGRADGGNTNRASANAKAAPVTTHPCRAPCFADRPRQNRNPCPRARRWQPGPGRLPRPAAPRSRRACAACRGPGRHAGPPAALQRWYYVTYRKRLPSLRSRNRLRIVFGFARQALIAACHEGPWWQLDDWHPRCDPRIPLINRSR